MQPWTRLTMALAAVGVLGAVAAQAPLDLDAAGPHRPPPPPPPPHQHQPQRPPNIVFVLTDDQDLHLDSLAYLPKVQRYLADEGTSFWRHYCTIAICCPSRVNLLTGKCAHNTNVTDVKPPYGGYPKFIAQGFNDDYLPVWLQQGGYSTYYTGKFLNGHNLTNYASPHAAGWTANDFLLDPYTYRYLSPAFQRNLDPPVVLPGQYQPDLLKHKAEGFLDDALAQDRPFFLAVGLVAPHAEVNAGAFTAPIPPPRFASLFPNVTAPRPYNFNPEQPSGASWVKRLPRLNDTVVAYGDEFYRKRIQTIQTVDETVESLVQRLDQAGQLDNTYIVFTADNGYHIGQHRMHPGKTTGYEEDVNVPLIVRGPGIARGAHSHLVSSHTDLAPTFLKLAGIPLRPDFDGAPIPLTPAERHAASRRPSEHVNIEFWGVGGVEGIYGPPSEPNNTFKSLRIAGDTHNVYYSVWCTNEHELYDLNRDPGQMHNLLQQPGPAAPLFGRPLQQVVKRLDALLLVLKGCKQDACRFPWRALQPRDRVDSLQQALAPRFDALYDAIQQKVSFSECKLGQLLEFEGAQFRSYRDLVTRDDGSHWSDWV